MDYSARTPSVFIPLVEAQEVLAAWRERRRA